MSNFTSNPEQTQLDIEVVAKCSMYISQGLGLMYALLCVLWLVYVGVSLSSEIRKKRALIRLMNIDFRNDYTSRLFIQKEIIFRYVIFLLFLFFELLYSIDINIYGIISLYDQEKKNVIQNFQNCSSIFSSKTSHNSGVTASLQNIFHNCRDYAFSMMIWLFGMSLLHLSNAARNELKVKLVLRFFLFGIFINTSLSIIRLIPNTSIFSSIALSLKDQISLFIVLYIAKKKFFPAMNSRVIDAFHLHNTNVYLKQKRLLKQYKVLVIVFLITFEIYIFKYIISGIFDMILMMVYARSCWPDLYLMFSMPNPVFQWTSPYSLIIFNLMSIVVRTSFVMVNTNIMYVTVKRYLKSRFCTRNIYRYRVCSDPLLS